ncbi:MAG: ATP-dependent DNA helicase, partial [bacterium]
MVKSDSAAAEALGKEGPFHTQLEGFTPRLSQQQMAATVADTLEHGGTLVAESGTGTGKTFAYLVPILLGGERTIVSTGTRHLQDQIFHRDLPTVAKVLGRNANAVVLKGRSNYLCRYRLRQNSGQSELIGKASDFSFSIIERWAASTRTGDIAEVSEISDQAPVWKEVTSTVDNCLGGKCPDFKKCFVTKARQSAMEADVVVVNHHLFFSDLTLKDDGFGELLPQYEAVVFDEAHTLSDIASVFFGFSVSSFQVHDLCTDILRAEKEENSSVNFATVIPPLQQSVEKLQTELGRLGDSSVDIASVDNPAFRQDIERLQVDLDRLMQQLEIAATAGEGLARCYERALLLQERLDLWVEGHDRNLVRWISVGQRWFRLQANPLRIRDRFVDIMQRAKSWIFTSATLAVGDDFNAFSTQLGLEQGQHSHWPSPYDFERNALLYLPTDMPDPHEPQYALRIAEVILEVTGISKGRAFCLFTSHAMLNKVGEVLKKSCRWPLMMQGEAPRSELMDRFQKTPNSVLLGTSSFWEGVDIIGDALSCVIIDKLPFAAPGEPVLKSRLKACEEEGGNPFMEIQIPSAAISLKQGAGRLIRSETDRGLLV